MKPGSNTTTARRVAKASLSLLLAVQAISSLMNNPMMNAFSDDTIDYTKYKSAAEARAAAEKNIALTKQAATDPVGDEPIAMDVTEVAPAVELNLAESQLIEEKIKALGIDSVKAAPNLLERQLVALDSTALDDIRGGFDIPDTNLRYSFGIERAVYINGELVAHTVLTLRDLQVAGGGTGPQQVSSASSSSTSTGNEAGAVAVIQNGPVRSNSFTAQVGSNSSATVIQNSLNNQRIQNVTKIDAAVNSAQVMRSMSVQSAVQNGIVSSLRR